MIRSLLLIKASLFSIFFASAQQNIPLINSGEEIAAGLKLYEDNQYKEAMEHYSRVSSGDTNYVAALFELARTCIVDSQYEKGLEYCRLGINHSQDREKLPDFLSIKGILHNDMGEPDKALKIYDSALARFPASMNLYINKGNTLFHQKKYAEASTVFKQGLLINPYSSTLHFNLGVSELKLGNPVCSFLALTAYLIMEPTGPYSGNSIGLLSNISQATDDVLADVNKRKQNIPDAYTLIEEIVLSKIAHEKNYKPIIRLDDKISRQMQVMFEKLEYDANEQDFFMQYYVPYFKKVFTDDKFEVMVNYAFSSADIEVITKYNKDHKKEIKRFEEDLENYFTLIRKTRELHAQKRDDTKACYYFSGGKLASKGLLKNGSYLGDCIFYFPAGNIKSQGRLLEKEEKDGEWKYYFPNGTLKAIERFKNGKQEGDEIYYYDNGNVSYTASYKNNNLHGKKVGYYIEGNLKFVENYKDGKLNGEFSDYYISGIKKSHANYVDNKAEGPFVTYTTSGKKEKEGTYAQGMLMGQYKFYNEDGTLTLESAYDKDEVNGARKTYHDNGKLKSVAHYTQGKLNGEYAEYYDNGQLYYKCIYVNDVYNGDINFYDDDGIVHCMITYDKDIPVTVKYFDKKGKEIASSVRKNGLLDWVAYSPGGFKDTETPYNNKNVKNGNKKYYFNTGKLSATEDFVDDELNGKSIGYHPNGKLSYVSEFKDGKRNGYFTEYSVSGVKIKEGWHQDGEQQGKWLFYDERGNLTNESNFISGMTNGIQKEFWPNGKLHTTSNYEYDRLQEVVQYDTSGKVYNQINLVNGSGKYVLLHMNGKPKCEALYKNGQLEGKYTNYYFDGSLESIVYYKGGLLDSVYRYYRHGGKVKAEGHYALNNKNETWKYYGPEGKLSSMERYKNDELTDSLEYYHDNGKLSFVSFYENGVRQGKSRRYSEDGYLVYVINYKDGYVNSYSYQDSNAKLLPEIKIPGDFATVKTYFPNGKLSAQFSYENRKLKGMDNDYYSNGNPHMLSTENYGNTEGSYKQFFPSGRLKLERNYMDDNLHGEYKEYYESGMLKTSSVYYNGSLHGVLTKHDEKGKVIETQYYYYGDLLSVKK